MDPLTAFGPVAGVLQVIDFSFKAVISCREIYKDGSLADHLSEMEVTKFLGKYYRVNGCRPSNIVKLTFTLS